MNDSTVAKKVVVKGGVQGVFFRDSTQSEAQSKGVSGWVTNRSDGAVDAMVSFARSGPSAASVEDVEVSDAEPEGHSGFSVR